MIRPYFALWASAVAQGYGGQDAVAGREGINYYKIWLGHPLRERVRELKKFYDFGIFLKG